MTERSIDDIQGIEPVEYEEAHNWVDGALDRAEQAGIQPYKGFDTTKFLLADDEDESIPIIEYEFGQNGKHCFVAESEAEFNYNPEETRPEHIGRRI